MKGILIDPWTKSVTEVQIDKGLNPLYKAMDCSCITAPIILENNDTFFLDDEGLFKENSVWFCLGHRGYEFRFVGKAVVLGGDEEGDSVDAKSSIDDIRKRCTFTDMVCQPM